MKYTTSGSAKVAISEYDDPRLWDASDSIALAASGAGAEIVTPDMLAFGRIAFKVSGLTSETVSVAAYLDAANTIETGAIRPLDINTGAIAASSNLGNGSYIIENNIAFNLHFTKSGSSDTPTITYLGLVK